MTMTRRFVVGCLGALVLAVMPLHATVLTGYSEVTFDGIAHPCNGNARTFELQAFDHTTQALVYAGFYAPSAVTIDGNNVTFDLTAVKDAVGDEDVDLVGLGYGLCGHPSESTVAILDRP